MKNAKQILFSIFIFGLFFLLTGCGQQQAQQNANPPAPSPASAIITISGKLEKATITSGVKSYATAEGYKVVAIDNSSSKTYYASSDASGNFSLEIPSGISYEVSLVDSSNKYFGPIVMSGNSASSEVVMGIIPNTDSNLGQIILDANSCYAKPTSEPSAMINQSDKAAAASGKPKGAGDFGKEVIAGETTREGADIDKDGISNVFDADEDNDGIRNGIISTPHSAAVVSAVVDSIEMDSNIWADHSTTQQAKDIIMMRLHVRPKTGHESEISSVQCISVPGSINNTAIIGGAGSLGSPSGYPAEHTPWVDTGYSLYKTTTLTLQEWVVLLIPKANMNVGDVFTIRVNFTSGGYQDFFLSTSYVLTDWAKIQTVNGAALGLTEGNKSTSEAAVFSASSLEVVYAKPLDEDGNVVAGLKYSIIVGTAEADNNGILGVPTNRNEFRMETNPTAFSEGAQTISVSIHELYTFQPGSYYYITPVAESVDGQRNGEEVWFKGN